MKHRFQSTYRHAGAYAALLSVLAAAGCSTAAQQAESDSQLRAKEDIFVLRSWCQERIPNSTYCTRTRNGFDPFPHGHQLEDRFSMSSIALDPSTAKAALLCSAQVGRFHACLGPTADPRTFNFRFDGEVAGIALAGSGPCVASRVDFPEKGISMASCVVILRDLPAPYLGAC